MDRRGVAWLREAVVEVGTWECVCFGTQRYNSENHYWGQVSLLSGLPEFLEQSAIPQPLFLLGHS